MSDMDLLEALDDLIINNKPDRDQKAIEALVLTANQESINYLRENDLELSLELLRKSEILLSQEYEKNGNEVIYKLIGLTLNNLGCYYKKTNKLKVAHRYLKKALEIETEAFDDKVNLASTNLNMCAILSSLKQHNEAIKHAKTALELLEAERKNYSTEAGKEKEKKPEGKDGNEKYKSIVMTMIMAHFNYGIELEYVKDYNTSLETMKSGLDLAIGELGADNSLTKSIKKAIKKVSVKKKEADEKMQKREDYLSKQSEYTQTRRSESEEKPEVAVPVEKSTRTMSVHQVLYKHKSPRKPTKRYLEIAHDIKNIYSSESSNIILPAIKERPRKEVEPENREKIKASPEERRATRVGKSPNNVNLPTLHKTVGGESSSIDSSNVVSPQRSAVATRKKKDGRTSPKNDPMRLESESGSLSIPVHKKLSEPLMQRKMESTGENSPAHLKSAVSQRSNMNGLMKSMVQSTRGGDLEAALRNDEESSNWNGSRLNTDNQSILKGYSSRSPQGGFVNDDAKRRVLKHKFFMSKANLAPVNIKKDLFNRNGEFVGRLPNTTKPGKGDRETEK